MAENVFQKRMVIASIMLATVMQTLDTTIANVALPHIQGALSVNQDEVSWVLTSYIVSSAIMMAPIGYLATRWGRKKVFMVSIAGFVLTSVLCGTVTNLTEMVVFRLLQGIFGAGLIPLSQAVLLDSTPREKHGQAMAMWGVGIMLGPILGPTLGGWLTEYYNWRWIFYINLPVGLAAFIVLATFMDETDKNTSRKFDTLGFALIAIFIGALQMMLDRGEQKNWFSSLEITTEAILSGLSFYLFIVHILTTKQHAFLDVKMFKDRNYSISLVFMFIFGIILLGSLTLLPPFLQNLMNYPVFTTGLVMAPRGIGTMIAMFFVGRLTGKVDTRWLLLIGLSLTALSLYEMSLFTIDAPASLIVRTGIVQGFGMGFVFVPLSTFAYSSLAAHFRNDAAAIFSLVRNIGSSVGVSIVVTLLERYTQINHQTLGAHLKSYGVTNQMIRAYANDLPQLHQNAQLVFLDDQVNIQAATIGYLNDFLLMTYIVLLSYPLLIFFKTQKRQNAT